MKSSQPDPEVAGVMQAVVPAANLTAVQAVKGVMLEANKATTQSYQKFLASLKA